MSTRSRHNVLAAICMVGLAAVIGGCSGQDVLQPDVDIINRASQALGLGEVDAINGTYGSTCLERSGAWSVVVTGGTVPANPLLSVIKNDSDCELTLTEIVADGVTYDASPNIELEGSYQLVASAFVDESAGESAPISFYANARMSPTDFSSDFTITVLYSDDPNVASGSNNASYAEWSSSAVGDHVAAPNYSVTDNVAVQTDANDVVTLALGSVDLTDGLVTGEHYIVDLGTLPASPTYAQIHAVFEAATPTAISGEDPSIPVADFALDEAELPVVRTLVIRHMENDVPAYQAFRVTFNAP